MGNPRKIKVKRVQVADPEMIYDLEAEGDTFPAYVKVNDTVTWNQENFPAGGTGQPDPGGMTVTVTTSFQDEEYGPNQTLYYNITLIQFSNDNLNWSDFTGTLEGGSGSVNTGSGAY